MSLIWLCILSIIADSDDLVTAVEFSDSGEHLAIGDKAGRVSIVQEAFPRQPNSVRCYNQSFNCVIAHLTLVGIYSHWNINFIPNFNRMILNLIV
jgi:hypothetical protein